MESHQHRTFFVCLVLVLLFVIAVPIGAHLLWNRNATSDARTVAPVQLVAGTITDDNDPLGLPVIHNRRIQVLHKQHFTVAYDNERREPAWVSYALAGPVSVHGPEDRPRRFVDDPAVEHPAHHDDYTDSGYDRGHMCPAHAMWSRFGDDAMRATFITSNIIPQRHSINAGVWKNIESMIAGREGRGGGWAETYGSVFVTDGPIYGPEIRSIPGGEPVPDACFMIVLRQDGASWTSLAFEVPNADEHASAEACLTSIRKIEDDTGLDFDVGLSPADQDALEERASPALWR